ncbi:MAG: hypothetical protein ACOYJ1_10215 [Peptococcales bacterium]|jgi:hypothetical protein
MAKIINLEEFRTTEADDPLMENSFNAINELIYLTESHYKDFISILEESTVFYKYQTKLKEPVTEIINLISEIQIIYHDLINSLLKEHEAELKENNKEVEEIKNTIIEMIKERG